MIYHEFTKESKLVKTRAVFRIKALKDILKIHVKRGFGWFYGKTYTLQGNAWVIVNGIVVNSHLKDDVIIVREALHIWKFK